MSGGTIAAGSPWNQRPDATSPVPKPANPVAKPATKAPRMTRARVGKSREVPSIGLSYPSRLNRLNDSGHPVRLDWHYHQLRIGQELVLSKSPPANEANNPVEQHDDAEIGRQNR